MASESPETPRRLHPASVLFQLLRLARQLVLPALAAIVFSRGNYPFWVLVFLVPAAGTAILKYLNYRYRFGDDGLVIRAGIVTRNERHVPYGRIQNINLVQGPLHRMLGVAEVRLETAGGTEPEAVMRVLSLEAVETLRAGVFARREKAGEEGAEPAEPESRELVRLGPLDLVRFGIASQRGLVLVAAAIGVLFQSDLIEEEEIVSTVKQGLAEATGSLTLPGPLVTAVLAGALLLVFVVALQALSVVWAFLRFHGFTLRRKGEDLRADHGLLTRVSATIPTRRIQLLSVRRGPMHRLFRSASVRVDTAGSAGQEGDKGSGQLWLAPIFPESRVSWLIEATLPDVAAENLDWSPLAERAEKRVRRRSLAAAALLAVGAGAAAWPWGLLVAFPAAAWAMIHASLYVRHTAWATTDRAIFFRSGWWVRRLSVVRFTKTQVVSVHESPFDRRHDMATVDLDTAGAGRLGHRVRIPYLEASVARATAGRLGREAAATVFHW